MVAAANGTYSAPVTLVEGANSFTAVATDPAGNSSTASTALDRHPRHRGSDLTITDPKNGVAYKDGGRADSDRWANTSPGHQAPAARRRTPAPGSLRWRSRCGTPPQARAGPAPGPRYAACGTPVGLAGTSSWSKGIVFAVVKARSLQLTITVTDLAGNVATEYGQLQRPVDCGT